jgi:hypothetical protein
VNQAKESDMAIHSGASRHRSANYDRVFIGFCTTVFLGLSAMAAWSVWAAFH